ncbi:MAG: hypothetical protein ACFCVK_22590 [Acidimicrobiales bacterium]
MAGLIAEASAGGRWVLAVDDVSSLDPASAAVVHQCLITTGCPFVATARSFQHRPGAIDALWSGGRLSLVTLEPLDDDAIGSLITEALDGPIDLWTVRRLTSLAAGNPMSLRELMASAIETSALTIRHGRWVVEDGFQEGTQLQALVEVRLATVTPALRRACELVALGEPLPLDGLTRLVDAEVIDELVRRGLVIIVDGTDDSGWTTSVVRSRHPLFGEVLRAQLPASRMRRMAGELEGLLPGAATAGPAFLRRALLHLQGGQPSDADLLTEAARAARSIGDRALAIRFATAALVLAEQLGRPDRSEAIAALTLAAVHAQIHGLSSPHFERAFDLALDADQRAAVMAEHAWCAMTQRDAELAIETLRSYRARSPDEQTRLQGEALLATFIGFGGRWRDAKERSSAILRRLGPEPSSATDADIGATTRLRIIAHSCHAMAAAFDGPSAEALESARAAQRLIAVTRDVPAAQVQYAMSGEIFALAETEGFGAANRRAVELADDSRDGRRPLGLIGLWYRSQMALATMSAVLTEESRHAADDALRYLRWQDEGRMYGTALATRALFAVLTGDLERAESAIGHYERDHAASDPRSSHLANRARSWQAAQRGDLDGAARWADRAWVAAWEQVDAASWAIHAAHDLVRFGRPEAAVDRLAAAATQLGGRFSAALLAHARALEDRDAHGVAGAAALLGACGATGLQAEALAQAAALAPGPAGDRWIREAAALLAGNLLATPLVRHFGTTTGPDDGRSSAPSSARPPARDSGPGEGRGGDAAPPTFERCGRNWAVTFAGRTVVVRDLVGVGHLATLVAYRGTELSAVVLAGGAELVELSRQAVLDDRAAHQLAAHGLRLTEQLRRSRLAGDWHRVEQLEIEAEAVADELRRGTNPSGTARAFAGPAERARTAVRKAIIRAIDEIRSQHPAAADHLAARVRTGVVCRYSPIPDPR